MYKITYYSYNQAKKLGVDIKSSGKKNKKIDVIKNGVVIASIGDTRYNDYPTYLELFGKTYADERRRLYRIRHKKDRHSGAGYYASAILW